MKAITSLFCILALVTISKSSSESEEDERMKAIVIKCKKETQLEEAGVTEAVTKKMELPTSQKAKCMAGCIMRETGMISNGKIDKEGTLKVAEKYYSARKEEMEKAKTVVDICEKRVGSEPDECNLGSKVTECMYEEAHKVGLKAIPLR